MLPFTRLGAKYLDLQLSTHERVVIRIIERPARWMSPEALQQLVGDLQSVVAATLEQGSLAYGVVTGDRGRLENAILTVLYDRNTRRPVAFNALSILPVQLGGKDEEVLHLGLVMVDPAFRSQGLSWTLYGLTCLLTFVRQQLRPIWVSNVTQVPAIVGMVSESLADVFPSPRPGTRRTYAHLTIARQIMKRHRSAFGVGPEAGFDQERFVITDSYTGGSDNLKKTFASAPKHRDQLYNEMCRLQLDYGRGDDFLQIGRFNLAAARNYLLRSVPRRSLPALLYRVVFLFLGSALVPVLHWFTPSKPMGDLRPWKA
jgi:hypothetical protein